MIEIGTGILSALASVKQSQRKRKHTYATQIDEAGQQAQKLREEYAENTAYLFRTSAEKIRQSYQAARAELTRRQANLAARGITGDSASAQVVAQQTRQQADLGAAATQKQLQTQAALQERNTKTALQKLADAVAYYRRAAAKKNRFGSLGAAFATLFK